MCCRRFDERGYQDRFGVSFRQHRTTAGWLLDRSCRHRTLAGVRFLNFR